MTKTIPSRGAIAVLAVVSSAVLASCSSGSSDSSTSETASTCTPQHADIETVTDGEVTVGVIDIVPFSSYNSGTPEGIDISVIEEFAAAECLDISYQQATYADAIQSISSGVIDLAVGCIDVTEARLEVVDFTDSIYLDGMGIASATGAETIEDLEAMDSVGTVDGYLWNEDVEAILGDKLKTYPSSVELKADFDAGRLDAALDAYATLTVEFADNTDVTVSLVQDNPDERVAATVQAPETAFPITKGNTSLAEALNATIAQIHTDGTIVSLLEDAGLSTSLADISDTQYIVPASS